MEKNFSLLPEPYNIEVVACDEEIPDPLENMSKTAGPAVALGEGRYNYQKLRIFEENEKNYIISLQMKFGQCLKKPFN